MYEMIDRYVRYLIDHSTPRQTAWNMELIREGRTGTWNYIDGCMLNALIALGDISGDDKLFAFAESVLDAYVQEDGSILTLKTELHRLDDINEGRALFPAWQRTGKEKYRRATETLKAMLDAQPRTDEGSYWHKQIYTQQVWLDGIYMAQPFMALFEREFGNQDYSDILKQVRIVRKRMRDEKTGLYYHGYDSSKSMYWADKETGISRSFWLRSIGWFSIALADLIEIIPEKAVQHEIGAILRDLMASIAVYADPETEMYYQVVDQGSREGNYLESSGSSMVAYAMMKGARFGILDVEFAEKGKKTFDGIIRTCLKAEGENIGLTNICLVSGLGDSNGKPRDGSYEYYISEPVVCNDAKGVAPFVLCYSEIRQMLSGEVS